MELARSMDLLPTLCVVYTIEGENYEMGEALSARVEAAMESMVKMILKEIKAFSDSGVMHA
ncbi:MAG: hypothetical protein HKN08_12560 [Gammaproteobacteria bacterium]|nr:hypothetical protein [Gammaproteobacteria bacterium]